MSTATLAREPLLRRPEIRFPVRFLFVGVVLAMGWGVLQPTSGWLRQATAAVVMWISNVVGLHATTEPGAYVRFVDDGRLFRYVIDDGCTATLVIATYVAAVVAYPSDRRSRALGVALGVPVLLALNLVRLVSLGWVGLHARDSFDAIHHYWWQVFFVTGTGAVWFVWAWRTSGARTVLSRRRAVSTPRTATTACVVGVQLVAFAVLGLWGHGADLYYRLIRVPFEVLAHVLWDGRQVDIPGPTAESAFTTYAGNYALLAAVVALFLASPGLDLRTRVRGVLRWALPAVVSIQVTVWLWLTAVESHSATEGAGGLWHLADRVTHPLMFALHVGLSLVVWQAWLQRAHDEEERRGARAAARRRGGRTAIARRRL